MCRLQTTVFYKLFRYILKERIKLGFTVAINERNQPNVPILGLQAFSSRLCILRRLKI